MNKFIFIDLETTGLDPATCHILEFAVVIADSKLNEIEHLQFAISTPPEALRSMDSWCRDQHKKSGLLDEVQTKSTPIEEVELQVLSLVRKHFPVNRPAIAGSSVHFDRAFISHHMPRLSANLHYRIIDVSSFMGALSIYQGTAPSEKKAAAHRALEDVRDSVTFLKQYLEKFKA